MTDNEIIKALECCQIKKVNECAKCPYLPKISRDCERFLVTDALDLITRQKAEIERLTTAYPKTIESIKKMRDMAKAEAIKEFAERLKGTFPQDDFLRSTKRISEDIDNLVKEMVGDV